MFDLLKGTRQLLTPKKKKKKSSHQLQLAEQQIYARIQITFCILLISVTVWHFTGPPHTTPSLASTKKTHCNDEQVENNYEIIKAVNIYIGQSAEAYLTRFHCAYISRTTRLSFFYIGN